MKYFKDAAVFVGLLMGVSAIIVIVIYLGSYLAEISPFLGIIFGLGVFYLLTTLFFWMVDNSED